MKWQNCRICGTELPSCDGPHIERVGEVEVKNWTRGPVVTCAHCGAQSCSKKEARAYKQHAAEMVLEDGTKVNASVVVFAREALGFEQQQLAKILGRPVIDIMRWETGEAEVPRRDQRAMAEILNVVRRYGFRFLKSYSIPALKEPAS